jgi:predicted solute-binding protein
MPIPLGKVLLSKTVNMSVFEEVQNKTLHLTQAR